MGTATVKWIAGKQFMGIDSTQHSAVLSTPDEGVGIKPSELLLLAVASCTAVDVVDILAKKRMPITSLEVITSGEQDQDPPGHSARSTCIIKSAGRTYLRKRWRKPSSFLKKNIAQSPPPSGPQLRS